jgi:hypothetical protein
VTVIVAALIAAVVAGCGGSGGSAGGGTKLVSAKDAATLSSTESDLNTVRQPCVLELVDSKSRPAAGSLHTDVTQLIDVLKRNPDAIYTPIAAQSTRTVRQGVTEVIASFRPCTRHPGVTEEMARLRQALAAGR